MFLALTAALLAAGPLAKEEPAAPATAAIAPAMSTRSKTNPRVCVVDQVTGSRLPTRRCRLLEEWRAMGVDPLARN